MHVLFSALSLLLILNQCHAASSDIPQLNWQERSDWINVQTDVTPQAHGDGVADDTAALQAALNTGGDGKVIYLPPGTYRITQTLVLNGPVHGVRVMGHGRDTKIVWDGEENGRMFWSNGAAYTHYVGLSWDGRNKAAIGVEHAAQVRYETEVSHQHEAFRDFKQFGIRIGYEQKVASAEINYWNCLFENCGTGVGLLTFNDYDNSFDGCEFRNCGVGIFDTHGNFYARNCHFENSSISDFDIASEHGDSIRRCTSYGSNRFITQHFTIAPLSIENCHVANWKDAQGAIQLFGVPALMFDCVFTEPPSPLPPVRIAGGGQQLVLSNNSSMSTDELVTPLPDSGIYNIPSEEYSGVITDAHQTFLRSEVAVPTKIFDAKVDFSAKGDGVTDDTLAIQNAIDAAREFSQGALAYLPSGRYIISQSLNITGSNYHFGGMGFTTRLVWQGAEDGVSIEVVDPQNITLEGLVVGTHDLGQMKLKADIRQTSTGGPSSICYDNVAVYGMYQKQPDRQGLHFENLSATSVVHGLHVQGNLRFKDCAQAKFLFAQSYEGTITVEGKDKLRDGLLGFMFRLTTVTTPTVHLRDNQSIVMSDFYNEQSDGHLLFEGGVDDPPGYATICGPKMHLNTTEPVLQAQNYGGRIFLGFNQFYLQPEKPRLITTGDKPLELMVAGHFCYNTTPDFQLAPTTNLTCIANRNLADTGLERPQAMVTFTQALDDFRRLGRLDHEINGWLDGE